MNRVLWCCACLSLFSGCLEALILVPLAIVGETVKAASSDRWAGGPTEYQLRCSFPPGDPRRWSSCPEPAKPDEAFTVVCSPESLPEWAGASPAEKRALYRRCHVPAPGLPAPPLVSADAAESPVQGL
jgi:hypothetical protein